MTRARLFSTGNVGVGGGATGGTANITLAGLQPFLTTANVVELTSLYFSNTRVYANLQLASIDALYDVNVAVRANGQALIWNGNIWAPGNVFSSLSLFTTADLREAQSNLYYTNARARTAFTAGDPTITIDWNTGTIRANVTAIANASSTSDAVLEGSVNKYFTNARSFANLQLASINDLFDVVITNVANNQVLSYNGVTGKWQNNTISSASANFAENSNLANVSLTSNVANVVLSISNFTTANLIESSANLYFTNARVLSALSNATIRGNLIVTGILFANNIVIAGTEIFGVEQGTSINVQTVNANTITANTITAKVWRGLYTANILESSSNIFFTNARVNAVVQPFLTTANVRELSSNLYFTYARANAAIWPSLTTANVIESAGNVYFTNARVLLTLATNSPNVRDISVNGNLLVYGNVAQLNVGNVQISSRTITIAKDAATPTAAEGAGIYINGANAKITYGEVGDTIGFNKDITVHGNILPAISGVYNIGSADKKFLSLFLGTQTIFLGNVALGESPKGGLSATTPTGAASDGLFGNLIASEYVTLDRVYGNVLPITELNPLFGGNVLQFTSNVTGNLYFGIKKNDDWNKFAGIRVVQTRVTASNVRSDVIIYNDNDVTNNSTARISVLGDGNVNILGNIYLDRSSKFDGNVKGDLIGNVIGTVSTLFNHSTDSLKEGTNLYYTNARVNAWMQPFLTTANVQESSSNLYFTYARANAAIWPSLKTANVVESASNLYFTYARANAAIWPSLTTANVVESASTLYYTNSRVRSTLSNSTGVYYNSSTGAFSIGQDVATTSTVTFNNLTITGNVYVLGNASYINSNTLVINDPLIQVGYGNPSDAFDLGLVGHYNNGVERHAGIFRDHNDGNFKIFDNLSVEPGTNDINTGHATFRYANLVVSSVQGNLIGDITGTAGFARSISNFNTGSLAEGSNQYFTNARVLANVEQMSINVFADVDITGIQNNYILIWNGTKFIANEVTATTAVTATYANVSGISNFANTAGIANVALVTNFANVSGITNFANVSGTATVANTVLSLSNFTTANLVEGTNLYFTNDRVAAAFTPSLTASNVANFSNSVNAVIQAFLTTANVIESGSNLYFNAARVNATVQPFLTTANVVESASNLYFTNTRVVSALIAGNSIIIEANGRISANVNISAQDTVSNANIAVFAYVSNVANTVLTLNNFTTANLSEGVNLYYTNARTISAVTPLLTTANVIESTNLYFTNARVVSALIAGQNIVIEANGRISANVNLVTTVSDSSNSNIALFAYIANIANTVLSLSNFTTANLVEGTNLYFTNARAAIGLTGQNVTLNDLVVSGDLRVQGNTTYLNVATLDIEDKNISIANAATSSADADGAGLTIKGADATILYKNAGDKFEVNKDFTINGAITANIWNGLYTSNVVENTNLYFTNTRVLQAVTPLLTTANVTENSSNLYFTNARSIDAVTNTTLSNLTISGNLNVAQYITTDRLYTSNVYANNLIIRNLDVTTTLLAGNIGSVAVDANIITAISIATNTLTAESITSNKWINLYSGNVVETTNQYFTNARVVSALIAGQYIIIESNGRISANIIIGSSDASNANIALFAYVANVANTVLTLNNFTTANLVEGINLYFTNARVLSAVTPLLTTANVVESNNQYFTNTRVLQAVTPLLTAANIADFNTTVVSTVNPLLTTANVAETTNQYFTNARVLANIEQMSVNVFADVDITGIQNNGILIWNGTKFISGQIITDQANVANTVLTLSNFTTTNLVEGSNLYYNDSRVYSNVANILPQYTGQLQAGNITTLNKVSYANTAQVVKVYQYYNEATQSLDTIFL